jgi:hypothetical protein
VTIDNALDIIQSIDPILYKWNPRDGNDKRDYKEIGFSAQNLLNIDDKYDLTDTSDKNNIKIKRDNLIPIITKCIQELYIEYDYIEKKLI